MKLLIKIFGQIILLLFLTNICFGTDSDVLITWEKPLFNVNGTKCIDYLGVRIYQRIDNEQYNFNNPIAVVYNNLYWTKSDFTKSGTYYWVLQSFDTSNNVCPDYTKEVTKTIKITVPFAPQKLTYH